MKCVILGLLLVATVAFAGDVDFDACQSQQQATIEKFAISDCPDGNKHCNFIKGSNYKFDIGGRAHFGAPTSNSLFYKVVATILGIDVPLLEGNACDNMTAPFECPINPGESILWSVDRVISELAPVVTDVPVYARIWANTVGTNDQAIGCAQIRVSIGNPPAA